MPNIGPFELILVLVIALVVFGPKRLPHLGRQLGTGMREFKDSISGESKDDKELDADDEVAERPAALRPATPQETAQAAGIPADDAAAAVPKPAEEPVVRPGS